MGAKFARELSSEGSFNVSAEGIRLYGTQVFEIGDDSVKGGTDDV